MEVRKDDFDGPDFDVVVTPGTVVKRVGEGEWQQLATVASEGATLTVEALEKACDELFSSPPKARVYGESEDDLRAKLLEQMVNHQMDMIRHHSMRPMFIGSAGVA